MSDADHGSPAAQAVTQVADILVRARILPVNELQTLRVPDEGDDVNASVVKVLRELLPQRIVSYDVAEIADDEAYAKLVESFAAVTEEAWHPKDLRSILYSLDDEAMVEFDQDDQHVLWRFHQPTEGVAPDFGRLVNSFTVAALDSAFVPLPTEDGSALTIYLPEPAATELGELLADIAADIASVQTTVPIETKAIQGSEA